MMNCMSTREPGKKAKRAGFFVLQMLLWIFGLFFLLGGLTSMQRSLPAAIAMIMLAVILIPLLWRKIKLIQPKYLNRKTRSIFALVLFVVAVAISPEAPAEPTVANTASKAPGTRQQTSQKATEHNKKFNKTETLTGIYGENINYCIKGAGLADTHYTLVFANGKSKEVKTGNDGSFTESLSKDEQAFGYVELTRDTNGFWFGGNETYKKLYYSLDENKPRYSEQSMTPIIRHIDSAPKYNISGYYMPNTDIILKSDDKILATTKVGQSGRFTFSETKLESNYTKVSILERISTGWFSAREGVLLANKYLDFGKHTLISELPTYTKEVSETKSIPFASQTIESTNFAKGETHVTQNGADGKKTITYIVTFKGSQQTDKKIKSEAVIKEPTPKITTIGTYVYIAPPAPVQQPSAPSNTPSSGSSLYFANCTAARNAGAAPILQGQPGYRPALDRDKDGVACET